MCVYECIVCVCTRAHVVCCWYLWKPDEGMGYLGAGVKGGCEPPDMGAGTQI